MHEASHDVRLCSSKAPMQRPARRFSHHSTIAEHKPHSYYSAAANQQGHANVNNYAESMYTQCVLTLKGYVQACSYTQPTVTEPSIDRELGHLGLTLLYCSTPAVVSIVTISKSMSWAATSQNLYVRNAY
eukprot:10641-Heterococcus_DN1.PRE.3